LNRATCRSARGSSTRCDRNSKRNASSSCQHWLTG